MLAYFKNYRAIAYAVSFAGPLVVIGIVLLATGINMMSGIAGGVVWLVCMLALMFIMSRYLGKKADEKTEGMVALYNDDCDPQAFKEEGRTVATAIYEESYSRCTTELGAWFLAPYALACADMDETKDAEMMEDALIKGIVEDISSTERAGILINIEPLTLRLHGPEAALNILLQAQSLLAENTDADAAGKRSYLEFEIPLLQSLIEGNTDALLARFQRVHASQSNPMRIRVLDADAEANIYEAMGETEAQRRALQFVVDNGNKLPIVEPARAKLIKL